MDKYRILGCAVLKQAVNDYYDSIKKGEDLEDAERHLKINDIWFEIVVLNKECFMKKAHERGKKLWLKNQQKKIT